MQRVQLLPLSLLTLAACGQDPAVPAGPDLAAGPAVVTDVTSGGDAGAGSLRAALEAAAADPAVRAIRIAPGLAVSLDTPLTFSGAQDLVIDGRGATITGPGCAGCPALLATGGGDLRLSGLTLSGAAGNGLTIELPAGATGTLAVWLVDVTIRDNGLHGVLIEDQVANSAAGVELVVERSIIEGNGYQGTSDFDGLRVNEGGPGGITARIQDSRFLGNGADGLELDERGEGGVGLDARESHFDDNGPLDPEDTDDGIDVDEADAGDILVQLTGITLDRNFDEGLDLNEAGEGSLHLTATRIRAVGNTGGDGIQLEELDAGDLVAALQDATASQSSDEGIQAEEDGDGSLYLTLVRATISGNADHGVSAEQGGTGGGRLELRAVTFEANGDDPVDAEGVTVVGK